MSGDTFVHTFFFRFGNKVSFSTCIRINVSSLYICPLAVLRLSLLMSLLTSSRCWHGFPVRYDRHLNQRNTAYGNVRLNAGHVTESVDAIFKGDSTNNLHATHHNILKKCNWLLHFYSPYFNNASRKVIILNNSVTITRACKQFCISVNDNIFHNFTVLNIFFFPVEHESFVQICYHNIILSVKMMLKMTTLIHI